MRGPHGAAAGLKLLVHGQRDVPHVADLGDAVPTGAHAFIGLQVVRVSNYSETLKLTTSVIWPAWPLSWPIVWTQILIQSLIY